MPKRKRKSYKSWLKAFIIALVILWIIKTFFFDIVVLRNDKMENTLFKGDVVLINKLKPGPRMPITLLSIPFTGNTLPFSTSPAYLSWIQLPYMRINISDIHRNDIIAFNYPKENDPPIDKKRIEIKRCVALPGDFISIHDKQVFVNKQYLEEPEGCKFRYRITALEPLDTSFYTKYRITYGHFVAKPYIYDIITSRTMADSISKDSIIKRIQILKTLNLPKFMLLFPYSPYVSWSFDYYGPLYVPKKEQTVNLSKYNIHFYKDIIEKYEKNTLQIIDDSIFIINEKQTRIYKFRYNYYFVLDDNRDQAIDSVFGDFCPKHTLLAKPALCFTI